MYEVDAGIHRGVDMAKPARAFEEFVLGSQRHGDELIVIGGPPRSGTTLVQNILDMHPDIIGGPEFLHLPDIVKLRQQLFTSLSRGWLDVYCTHEQVDTQLRVLLESLLGQVRAGQEARIISEKTPQNVFAFSAIAELFPGARFINVVRDPRAIVASLLQVYTRAKKKGVTVYPDYTTNTSAAIRYTRKCFNAGFAASHRFPDRIYTLSYENLVCHPETETKNLCNFLGIEWQTAMLRPSTKQHLGEKPITAKSGEIWYDKKDYYRDPDLTSLEKWKDTLSVVQQAMVTRAFKDSADLIRLGYNLKIKEFTWKARASASLVELGGKGVRRLRPLFHTRKSSDIRLKI
jgi:protein-tyrosine sulfotransferase